MCSLKTSFHINRKKIRLLRKNTRDGVQGPKEPFDNAEVEIRRSQKSRISKSFGPDFIAYAIESEPQIFKEAMFTNNNTTTKPFVPSIWG